MIGSALPEPDKTALVGVVCFMASGVLATVIGRLTLFRSVMLAGAINAGLFRRLIPVFAALFVFVVLGETIGLVAEFGMAVILASLLMVISAKVETPAGTTIAPRPTSDLRRGQVFGTLSAGSYGASYVARKIGMVQVPIRRSARSSAR